MNLYKAHVVAEITDIGLPWHGELTKVLEMPEEVSELPETGFGLYIANMATDKVRYWRDLDNVNHRELSKRL